jgi:hypothetical protein
MKRIFFYIILFTLVLTCTLSSCSLDVLETQGEQGIPGENGEDGKDGKDGIGILNTEINENGELVITLTDGTIKNLGNVVGDDGKDGKDGSTPYISDNGNWWIDGIDTGVSSTPSTNEFVFASSYNIVPGKVDSNMFNKLMLDENIKNKTILFADGVYVFSSTIFIPSNISIQGGANTTFKLDDDSEDNILLLLKSIDNVKISNLRIQGKNISRPAEKGNKIGIYVDSSRSINIDNLDIAGWDLYGIYGKQMSSYGTAEEGKFYKQLQITNTRFYNNYCGSYLDYRCEYTQLLNCVFGENNIGSINCGGNNMYVSCMWNSNKYGFILNNDGSNPAHGGANSCTFNHNDFPITVNNCVNGWTFDGCQVFYGKITLSYSKGVIFNSNVWGSCYFYSTFPGNLNQNLITNTYFLTDKSSILSNNDGSTFIYCCLPDDLPCIEEENNPENVLEDENQTQLLHTVNGVHPGASNCYFSNCSTPVEINSDNTNLYISIHGANYNTIVPDVNVWVVNANDNTVVEKIVDHTDLPVYYSKSLGEFVLNIPLNNIYDFPIYFVAQAIRENGVGISYTYTGTKNQFLDTTEVAIGQIIVPNSNIIAEFAVYTSDIDD